MTLKQYTVDAHFRVPYTTTVLAKSAEEAEEKAEEQAKKFSETFNRHHGYLAESCHLPHYGWGMTCDEVILQIDLTYPVNTCMRPFIPTYDD